MDCFGLRLCLGDCPLEQKGQDKRDQIRSDQGGPVWAGVACGGGSKLAGCGVCNAVRNGDKQAYVACCRGEVVCVLFFFFFVGTFFFCSSLLVGKQLFSNCHKKKKDAKMRGLLLACFCLVASGFRFWLFFLFVFVFVFFSIFQLFATAGMSA